MDSRGQNGEGNTMLEYWKLDLYMEKWIGSGMGLRKGVERDGEGWKDNLKGIGRERDRVDREERMIR